MEHRKKLEELNEEALRHFDNYITNQKEIPKEHHQKIHAARDEWQVAWTKLQETMLVLERLEI